MTAIWVVGGVVAVGLTWLVMTYNSLVRLRNEASQGFSGIEVQLKRRADLVPNLVETVKGYATHERETFEHVVEARAKTLDAHTPGQVAEADEFMRASIGGLFAVAEAYPDLQAAEGFLSLQKELAATEDRIAAARRHYNTVVRRLNDRIQAFPSNIVANAFRFGVRTFYTVGDAADRSAAAASFT